MEEIKLDHEQEVLFEIMENTSDNIFITGKAGTGKSVLLKYFVNNTKKNVVVLAPTGIAAINVGGQTIHSFFAFDYAALNPDDVWINDETAQLLQKAHTLIIDEISMVRSDIMESIDRKFHEAFKNQANYEDIKDLAFCGSQIIVFGDLYQLPPVIAEDEVRSYLNEKFGGPYFFDAPVIKKSNLKIYELEKIHRQKDQYFQIMLNNIRIGRISPDLIDELNKRVIRLDEESDILTIATTNKIVDEMNYRKFKALPGDEFNYEAIINGDVDQVYGQLESLLKLKVGAQVIMLRNHWQNGELIWANGTLGEIVELSDETVKVKIGRDIHDVKPVSWETRKHKYNTVTQTITKEKIGEFIQYPLRLAWALTIHKAQGQTYESVCVNLGYGTFLPGQAYVALSRCQSLDKLFLTRPFRASDIKIDNNVKHFIDANHFPIHGTGDTQNYEIDCKKREKTSLLISCSKLKRSVSCEAELMYEPSNLFRKSLAYAKNISDDIRILSAKYGLLKLDDVIEPYDETLSDKSKDEMAAWGKKTALQIFEDYDLQTTKFVILAGKDYYDPLMDYLPEIMLPLIGMPLGKRLAMLDYLIMSSRLHQLFNNMSRYYSDTINSIEFDSGIYIVFEKGENYYDMDRIVRVGTHLSDGRLKDRLKDHFLRENKDGSIFRKNIGRAILNKNNHPYLEYWNMNTSKPAIVEKMGSKYNSTFQKKLEKQISRYVRDNLSFICIPVATKEERLRLEEGIIASLNLASDFVASTEWRGQYSPEEEIRLSGMWLKEGLNGRPLSESEYNKLEIYCKGGYSQTQDKWGKNIPIMSIPSTNKNVKSRTSEVAEYISVKLSDAKLRGDKSVILISGEIHKELGLVSRMPTVCSAMRKLMKDGDTILHSPPKGNGSRLIIEYFL